MNYGTPQLPSQGPARPGEAGSTDPARTTCALTPAPPRGPRKHTPAPQNLPSMPSGRGDHVVTLHGFLVGATEHSKKLQGLLPPFLQGRRSDRTQHGRRGTGAEFTDVFSPTQLSRRCTIKTDHSQGETFTLLTGKSRVLYRFFQIRIYMQFIHMENDHHQNEGRGLPGRWSTGQVRSHFLSPRLSQRHQSHSPDPTLCSAPSVPRALPPFLFPEDAPRVSQVHLPQELKPDGGLQVPLGFSRN